MPRPPDLGSADHVRDDDGHPLAIVRDTKRPDSPPRPRPGTRSRAPATAESALLDDLEAVLTLAPTTPAARSRVRASAQSDVGKRSGAARAHVRALIAAYYADDDGRRLFELLDAAHAHAVLPGGQRDRQELLRQLAGAPDTSAPVPDDDDVQRGRALRRELRDALRGGAGAFLQAAERLDAPA